MARRAFKVVCYATIGGGGVIAAMYFGGSERKPIFPYRYAACTEAKMTFGSSGTFTNGPFIHTGSPYTGQPISKWKYDWDSRETTEAQKENQVVVSENESKSSENKIKNGKPVATRHLILIRHGQYNQHEKGDENRYLTPLGRQQADAVGRRLKELALPYTRMVCSTMTRAVETAKIMHEHLRDLPIESCDLLREGAPCPPEPPINLNWKPQDYYEDGARIESAFHKYFHRADPSQLQDSYEVIVCHANVIRYFLCRGLQLPPEAWLRFSLHNCSVTWIKIRPSGRVGAYLVGDCGHMPPQLLTTS